MGIPTVVADRGRVSPLDSAPKRSKATYGILNPPFFWVEIEKPVFFKWVLGAVGSSLYFTPMLLSIFLDL